MRTFDARDVVARKRDGETVGDGDIEAFVRAFTAGEIADEVAAAFLMAAYIRGLNAGETLALTRAYVSSGRTIGLRSIERPLVDKHSTGGVGDTVTLVFAPLAASLGLAVAKLSGRGLGHTGGTIDKLEAIPGMRTDLSAEELERQVGRIGCAVAAQGADIVPADGRLYALRDATATVASIPLIAASVMSKKLAITSDLVLLDVKAGSGAFMKTPEAAAELARACIEIARAEGRAVRAAVTDMSQPLGRAIGNALDVAEAVDVLSARASGRLREVVETLAAAALTSVAGAGEEEARTRAARSLDDGAALERFREMVEAQGGDPRVADDPGAVLPVAAVVHPVASEGSGYVSAVDAEALGRAAAALGAGRRRKDEPIDPSVGIVLRAGIGDLVEARQPLALVHAADADAARAATDAVRSAFTLSGAAVAPPPLVLGWLE
jgi:pyrimidine-nucleoside phosphorylase